MSYSNYPAGMSRDDLIYVGELSPTYEDFRQELPGLLFETAAENIQDCGHAVDEEDLEEDLHCLCDGIGLPFRAIPEDAREELIEDARKRLLLRFPAEAAA